MSPPLSYASECGPRTVAALTGSTPEAVAPALWQARLLWWEPHYQHPAGAGVFGTPDLALVDVLMRSGCDVEWWSGAGHLVAAADIFRTWLGKEAHARTVAIRHRPRLEPASTSPRPSIRRSLAGWLERHVGGGLWAYVVADRPEHSHVTPACGSRLLFDEDVRCLPWPVHQVYRVFKPRSC